METTMMRASCINCKQPFSLAVGRTPHLVKCGHSVCEKCLIGMIKCFQIIKCQGCQSEINIAPDQMTLLNKNIRENIPEIFPINYYIFGVLSYRAAQVNSIQNNLNKTRQEINSMGQAYNKYYPAGCDMNNTHLARQIQQKVPTNKPHSQDLEKHIKQLESCPRHPNKMSEVYCTKCDIAVCVKCMSTCGNHTILNLEDKNLEYDDTSVKQLRDAAKEVLLRINQKTHEIKQQLEISDTKENGYEESLDRAISNHFARVYGVLQVLQDKLESELKLSQSGLSDALKSLTSSGQDIEQLLELTDAWFDEKYKDKINVCTVVNHLKKAIQTPWYTSEKPNNQTQGDDVFTVNEDIFNQVENHCRLNLIKSDLKLLPTAEIPPDAELPPLVEAFDAVSLRFGSSFTPKRQLDLGEVTDHSYNHNAAISPPLKSQLEIKAVLNSFNPPANKFTSMGSITEENKHPKPLVVGSFEKVTVTHINSPHDFYIQRREMLKTIVQMNSAFLKNKNNLKKPLAEDIAPGKLFIIFDNPSKNWERVKIISTYSEEGVDTFFVQHIDYGHTSYLPADLLMVMDPPVMVPGIALSARLARCQPIEGKWTDSDNLAMHNIINRNSEMCIIMVKDVVDSMLEVDLVVCPRSSAECHVYMQEALLVLNIARLGNTINQVNWMNNPLIPKQRYLTKLSLDSFENVKISHVKNPYDFYIRKVGLEEKFCELNEDLANVYNINDDTGIIYTPIEGSYVACLVRGKWHRARVMNQSQQTAKMPLLYLVDTGEYLNQYWNTIRVLLPHFYKLDELCIPCKLADVKPIKGTIYWPSSAIQAMKKMIDYDFLHSHVLKIKTPHSYRQMVLLYTGPDRKVCLNHEFVLQGHAKHTGLISALSVFCWKLNQSGDENKPIERENDVPCPSNPKSLEHSGPMKLEVNILSAQNPSHILISEKSFEESLNILCDNLQKHYDKSEPNDEVTWKNGDKCAAYSDITKKWSRGFIEDVQDKTATVVLKDRGVTENVSLENLRILDTEFLTLKDGAIHCHLSGIEPAQGTQWPNITCEFLQELASDYDRFYITKDGEIQDKSLPIKLWIYHESSGDALSPMTKEWKTINDCIVHQGLAIRCSIISSGDKDIALKLPEELSAVPVDHVNLLKRNFDEINIQDDAAPPALIDDWLSSESLADIQDFQAIPTYVNDDFIINLYNSKKAQVLQMINSFINSHYKDTTASSQDMFWYSGQPCIARWGVDGNFYRGRVVNIVENMVNVLFVDYGNSEDCPISALRKNIVMTHVPIQSHRCKIAGVVPLEKKWSSKVLDIIHHQIVDKECMITTLGPEKGGVTPIKLKIASDFDLGELLISSGYARNDSTVEINPVPAAPLNQSEPDFILDIDPTNDNSDEMLGSNKVIEDNRKSKTSSDIDLSNEVQNSNAAKIFELYSTLQIPTNVTIECKVCSMLSVNKVIVKLSLIEAQYQTIHLLLQNIARDMQQEADSLPFIDGAYSDKPCIAQFSDDLWYRAKISQYDPIAKNIKVVLIDLGNTEILPYSKVRESKPEWVRVPPQTLTVLLRGIHKPDGVAPAQIATLFQEALAGQLLMKVTSHENDTLIVDLLDIAGENLIYQSLIDNGQIIHSY